MDTLKAIDEATQLALRLPCPDHSRKHQFIHKLQARFHHLDRLASKLAADADAEADQLEALVATLRERLAEEKQLLSKQMTDRERENCILQQKIAQFVEEEGRWRREYEQRFEKEVEAGFSALQEQAERELGPHGQQIEGHWQGLKQAYSRILNQLEAQRNARVDADQIIVNRTKEELRQDQQELASTEEALGRRQGELRKVLQECVQTGLREVRGEQSQCEQMCGVMLRLLQETCQKLAAGSAMDRSMAYSLNSVLKI